MIYATSIHKMELSNLTKNEIVIRTKHGGAGIPPFPLRVFGQDDFPLMGVGGVTMLWTEDNFVFGQI